MTKQLYFIAGLPRSGSTLLTNTLVQNPKIHCTPTSVLVRLVGDIKNNWHQLPLTKNLPEELSYLKLKQVLKSLVDGYFADVEQPVIFDKNRTWPQHIETLIELDYDPKIIAPVRDVREIVASFERKWSESLALGAPTQLLANPQVMQHSLSRLNYWLESTSPFGGAYNALLDGFKRGFANHIHLVQFENFTAYPKQELVGIYEFLGLEPFDHDVKNVKQTIFEDDRVHGFRNLHKIKEGAIKPVKTTWGELLPSDFAQKIAPSNFWLQ